MKRLFIKPIDDVTALLWKTDTLNYLKGMQQVPEPMEQDLMKMLRPHYKPNKHMLLDPDMRHNDAIFLRTGLAKLYIINVVTGKQQILYVWIEGEIIVLHKIFRNRLENTRYYIQLIEDAELVSISNDCMDKIYAAYPTAERLTTDILDETNERRMKQLEILSTVDKSCRREMFELLFPEFCYRLSNSDMCAFIGVTESTLGRSNR